MTGTSYILVTAARNEGAYIRLVLESVTKQTIPPQHWIIVSDGSTDDTDEIVRSFSEEYPYIELLHLDAEEERNFGSKAQAIEIGYNRTQSIDHEFVGILDADVSFEADYYEQVIQRFRDDPRLGIAGGVLLDMIKGRPVPQVTAVEWSVSGPVQMFRKLCWREIGGYLPIRCGIDAAAEIMSRMKGWNVRAFPDLIVIHHRQTGTHSQCALETLFHRGQQVYSLGYHPLFFLATTLRFYKASPFILGALSMLCGYCQAALLRKQKTLPSEVVRYLRQEQLQRLGNFFRINRRTE